MYIDFKITAWERVEFPDELEDTIKAMIKSGEIQTANDLFENEELEPQVSLTGLVEETEEYLSLDKNCKESTIEIVRTGNVVPIYSNVK